MSQGVHEAPSGQVAVSSPGEPWVEKWGGRTTPEQTGTSGAPELRFQVHRGGHGQQTGPREWEQGQGLRRGPALRAGHGHLGPSTPVQDASKPKSRGRRAGCS